MGGGTETDCHKMVALPWLLQDRFRNPGPRLRASAYQLVRCRCWFNSNDPDGYHAQSQKTLLDRDHDDERLLRVTRLFLLFLAFSVFPLVSCHGCCLAEEGEDA